VGANTKLRQQFVDSPALSPSQDRAGFDASASKHGGSLSRSRDPLVIWCSYVFVLLIIFVATLYKTLAVGIGADTSYFSLVIAGTFVCAFLYSFTKACGLRREWLGINRLNETIGDWLAPRSDAERLALSILNHPKPETVRIKDLVDSYYSIHELGLRTLSVISGLMVTLGLIGTILGLIVSIGGLENVMTQVESLSQGIFGGIKEAIRGMAIAFYSTLFGAVLGAVVLRMLSVTLSNSLVRMTCSLFEYLELLPKSDEQRIVEPLREATLQFAELTAATAGARTELEKFTSATLESRLANISAQLELCVAVLRALGK
jgi:hypothetical protein